jgi:ubiquinone/menaquinone biosynthesis C-methylase UbiE
MVAAIHDRLAERAHGVGAGRSLLELGCGSGALTLRLAEACPDLRIVAIDPSTDRLRKGWEAATAMELGDRVRFERADLGCLPIPDGTMSMVIAARVLGPASNPSAVLSEIHRAVEFGGSAFIIEDVPESGATAARRGTLLPSLNRMGRDEEALRGVILRSPFRKNAKLARRAVGAAGSFLEIELHRPEPPERPPTSWRRP